MLSTSVTQKAPDTLGTYWRYPEHDALEFNPIVFDETRLADHGFISGEAGAGRGNTYFLNLDNNPLVLRHYRRGGLARKVSDRRYIFTGLSRTRAMLEFDICLKMYDMQLPVPKPYACRVVQHGATYEASIVTHRLQGNTLAQRLVSNDVTDEQWGAIGRTIARFHKVGIYHADLNAHNILLSDEGVVSLIDFDRAKFRSVNINHYEEKWCVSNLARLQRSIIKEVKKISDTIIGEKTQEHSAEPGVFSNSGVHTVHKGIGLLRLNWISA